MELDQKVFYLFTIYRGRGLVHTAPVSCVKSQVWVCVLPVSEITLNQLVLYKLAVFLCICCFVETIGRKRLTEKKQSQPAPYKNNIEFELDK